MHMATVLHQNTKPNTLGGKTQSGIDLVGSSVCWRREGIMMILIILRSILPTIFPLSLSLSLYLSLANLAYVRFVVWKRDMYRTKRLIFLYYRLFDSNLFDVALSN